MTATFKGGSHFVLYIWRICIGSQHVGKAHGNYEGTFVCMKKAVQTIETHQNVVTPEWLGSPEPLTRLD